MNDMSEEELSLLSRAVALMASGDIIQDWEFFTIFGVYRHRLAVVQVGPEMSAEDRQICRQVIGNLLGYPHGENVGARLGCTAPDLQRLEEKLST